MEERVKKGVNAFYACKKLFGKKWGLQPYIVHWMYKAIIRPIITYGASIWWEAIEKGYNRKVLTKVQRLAAIGTTGVKKTTAQAALETILDLQPIELYIKGLAAKSALRLREINLWRTTNYGHARIIEEVGNMGGEEVRRLLKQPTDYMIGNREIGFDFTCKIPSREE